MGKYRDVIFEDSLHDDWSRDADILEVPIGRRPLWYLGLAVVAVTLAVAARVVFLSASNAPYARARAAANAAAASATPAPRGLIYDRQGTVLADNTAAFAALLDARTFVRQSPADQANTLSAIQNVFSLTPDETSALVQEASAEDFATPVVLAESVDQATLVKLQALALPAIQLQSHFERLYPQGAAF